MSVHTLARLVPNVVAFRRGCPRCAGRAQQRPQGRFLKEAIDG
jgi:hypothetical protein